MTKAPQDYNDLVAERAERDAEDDLPTPESMFFTEDNPLPSAVEGNPRKFSWQYGYPEIIFVASIGVFAFLWGVFHP